LYLWVAVAHDNLVLAWPGFSTMPHASGSGKGQGSDNDEIAQRFDRLEELVHSLTVELKDVKQNQQGLGVVVLRLEQQGTIASSNNMAPATPNAANPGVALSVNNGADTRTPLPTPTTLRHQPIHVITMPDGEHWRG
jgi:hypothetical protein